MSNRVAFKRQQEFCKEFRALPDLAQSWFVLKDAKGKVRDWVHAIDKACARRLFKELRDTGCILSGYTVEKRGPVTKENW